MMALSMSWEMIERDGVLYWHRLGDYTYDELLPVIAGGDDGEDEGDGEPSGDNSGDDDKGGDDEEEWKPERAKATILKLRGVEKEYKAFKRDVTGKLEKLEKDNETLKQAAMSEEEREAARVKKLEEDSSRATPRIQDLTLENAVLKVAGEVGIADGELAMGALDKSAVTWEDGKPTNVKELLTELLERKPILAGNQSGDFTKRGPKGSSDGGSGNGGKNPPKLTEEEAAMARRFGMDPEAFDAMRDGATLEQWEALQPKKD
jgi:hypothetical protein